jgi:sugar lactone lactonase YvrE
MLRPINRITLRVPFGMITGFVAVVITAVACRPRPPLVFDEPAATPARDTATVFAEARGAVTAPSDQGAVRAVPSPLPPPRARRVAFVSGLKHPESVLHDPAQDVYFVSNIDGQSAMKDGRGFIARVRPDGSIETLGWVASGKNDAALDAPKGMAITGDTLWVTDIDVVRGFDRRTGAPIVTIDLAPHGAVFLNDLVAAPNGALYVTDTQIKPDERGNVTHPGADRLFRIGPDRAVSTALSSDRFMRPNGIALDRRAERFLIVSFGGDTIFAWKPGSGNIEVLAAGPGQFDGIEITNDERVFITSQSTASLWELREGRLVEVIVNLPGAADLGYDAKRRRLMVPLTGSNRVEIYDIP